MEAANGGGKSAAAQGGSKATDLSASNTFLFSLKTLKLKTKQQELLIRVSILCLVYILAFITRLFSVLRYESMIHEFDPYFNYRTTLFLTQKGFYEFWNWFDSESWYPLGRIIGGTLYPGLMVTAALIYWSLRFVRFAVHIREVCVLTAPFFASNTTIVAYFFGKELWDSGAGLVAAALIAICPGYISRSVAGSYDNEGVAIFALLLTFYLFVKAVNTGSLAWALASAFGYFYMVSAWGGYVFIINLIPLYVLVLLITGRYSMRLYVAYNCMYVLGMLLAMQIRFVGFQHVQSGEHMAAMGVFFLMQVFYFLDWVKYQLNDPRLFEAFLRITVTCAVGVGALALGVGTASGYISPWTGRFYSLLDPTYAKDHIPIIASVSEHQPTAWSSFMFDFHILLFLFPAGLYFCFKRLSDATIFIVMYGLTSMYFAGVMVRLILVATPAVCLISAIAVSATIKNLTQLVRAKSKVAHTGTGKGTSGAKASSKASLDQSLPFQRNGAIALLLGAFYLLSRYATHCTWVTSEAYSSPSIVLAARGAYGNRASLDQSLPFQRNGAIALLLGAFYLLSRYATHCTWVTSEAYSSPSIVLAARGAYGNRVIFDDYREAYFWLRQNTPQDAKIMSWWDYGYQITAMGNRTVIVDNNTWNNTHIATVGRAMSSYEDEAYEIMRSLDVDYVLVVFGGVTGYSSDDINKFLWMVRIGGGVFPVIKEPDYLVNGEYRVDKGAAPKMLNCLMYKLSYYRFGELTTEYGKPPGYDRARGVEIGNKDVKLEYLEEAFTTSNWIVRIYKVQPPNNRW
ncbi:Dolichyl-diphosphooligosaccharide--protein glycosyltransferase subunit STT3B like [Actinidia chinensis var. chinensis]|uniref:dolichyl-diphosphooligosaccharide--protein glycotransferase n=1 Tax=Actinidia chinensis var. chinensis TaxID=1590841 RepID=A0A2R6QHI8_ACTCC|nr:Dolichyl-diphosphooligosaccharide--protein glycosyltransferase subunit STT3B like [Actinidia chinensis var. chinensis]